MFNNDKAKSIAVIDIGSNSTRFMLAYDNGGQISVVEKRISITRLGENIASTGKLSEEGIKRTLEVIGDYIEIINDKKIEKYYAYATSAVRDAKNKDEFIKICRDKYWLTIELLDEKSEAEISFMGAVPSTGCASVIDIGGGSTELAYGSDSKLELMGSIPLGAVRASELFEADEKGFRELYKTVQKQKIEYWEEKRGDLVAVNGRSRDLFRKIRKKSAVVYGVGGTITTLCALSDGLSVRYDPRLVHGRTMTRGEIATVAKELNNMNLSKNAVIPLLRGREDIIRHGAVILKATMDALDLPSIVVSDSDGMEGYLKYKLLKDIENERLSADKTRSAANIPQEFIFDETSAPKLDKIDRSSYVSLDIDEAGNVLDNTETLKSNRRVYRPSWVNDDASQVYQETLKDKNISISTSAELVVHSSELEKEEVVLDSDINKNTKSEADFEDDLTHDSDENNTVSDFKLSDFEDTEQISKLNNSNSSDYVDSPVQTFELPEWTKDLSRVQLDMLKNIVENSKETLLADENSMTKMIDSLETQIKQPDQVDQIIRKNLLEDDGASPMALENLRESISVAIEKARLVIPEGDRDISFILYDEGEAKPAQVEPKSIAEAVVKKIENTELEKPHIKIKRARKKRLKTDSESLSNILTKATEKKEFSENKINNSSNKDQKNIKSEKVLPKLDVLEKESTQFDNRDEFERNFDKMSEELTLEEELVHILSEEEDDSDGFSFDRFEKYEK